MARGRRGPRLSAAQAQALSQDALRAEAAAMIDAARLRANATAWEHESARLGIDGGRDGFSAYLSGAPDIDEDVVTIVDASAMIAELGSDGKQVAAALRERATTVLQLRADWTSSVMIRFGNGRLEEWTAEPGEDASADHVRWWRMTQQFDSTDPTAIRRATTTQAQGADTVIRTSGIQQVSAEAAQYLRVCAEAQEEMTARVADLLLSDVEPRLLAQYLDAAWRRIGMPPHADDLTSLDHADFTSARRLAQAYADAGRDAPKDLMLPHRVDADTLAQHGHERQSGLAAQVTEDERRRAAGYTHTYATFAHTALRALESGKDRVAVEVRAEEMEEFLRAHGTASELNDLHFTVRARGDDSQLVAVARLAGAINGEVRVAIAESVVMHAHGHDELTRRRLAEQAAPWLEAQTAGRDGPVARSVEQILEWTPPDDLADAARPRSAPVFASASEMLNVTPCAHEGAHWEENRERDARVLCCETCGARHLAVVPLHRVPGATIQPAKAYMARECFYAALEGRTPAATSLAALRRAEGEADMSPSSHLATLFVFPNEQDLASALFG